VKKVVRKIYGVKGSDVEFVSRICVILCQLRLKW